MKLSKLKIALLERAFLAEIDSAHHKCPSLIRSKAATALQLVKDGLFLHAKVVWHGAILEGFRLSDQGMIAFYEHCDSQPNPTED
jgi:hypothetical protein